jgi:hypothetical protein
MSRATPFWLFGRSYWFGRSIAKGAGAHLIVRLITVSSVLGAELRLVLGMMDDWID